METYHTIGEKLSVKCQLRLHFFQLLIEKTRTIKQPMSRVEAMYKFFKEAMLYLMILRLGKTLFPHTISNNFKCVTVPDT